MAQKETLSGIVARHHGSVFYAADNFSRPHKKSPRIAEIVCGGRFLAESVESIVGINGGFFVANVYFWRRFDAQTNTKTPLEQLTPRRALRDFPAKFW